ncbi:FkbM family methyltransferase [Gammaproteobacteria bacterium]
MTLLLPIACGTHISLENVAYLPMLPLSGLIPTLFSILQKLLLLLGEPGMVKALMSWPKFSFTSYQMIAGLIRQGIVPKTIVDVGANTGQFTVASAKLIPGVCIYSFEPQPACIAVLERNLSSLDNVTLHPLALGEAEGEVLFNLNTHSHSSSFLQLADAHRAAFPQAQETKRIPVKVSTLDLVFGENRLERPVLLKLDVQGYETQVLSGAKTTLQQVDYVVLEASFKPMYEGEPLFLDIMRIMEGHGFSFLRPVGWLTDPTTGEVLQMDALFINSR